MRLAHCNCAGLRRFCAPFRTGSNRQYSNFRRNLSAPVDRLLRRGCAGCTWCIAISRRNQDVTVPARIFNMLNICLRRALVVTERKRATDAASGRTDTSSAVYCLKYVRAESIEGPLRNHATYIAKTPMLRFRR